MTSTTSLPQAGQLRRALAIREQIETLTHELHQVLSLPGMSMNGFEPKPKRIISPAGKARIAAAQRLRWAKYNSTKLAAR